MKAIRLRTEHLQNPLGLENRNPLLSWCCEGGARQTACEVTAATEKGVLWSSGKVESSAMQLRLPVAVPRCTRVSWSVKLWDENNEPGEAAEAFFETAFDKGEDWGAVWINPELQTDPKLRYPASVLKKTFAAAATENARLYITCHGLYKAELNGARVGSFVLAPGVDEYAERLQYQVYDVTELLQPGENELTVTLGDGWYRGCNGNDGMRNLYGSTLALLCRLDVGGVPVLVSDESWLATQEGPIRYNDLEHGELYDAGKEQLTGWHGVKTEKFGFENLCCSDSVAVTENERFPGRVFTAPNGETVVDFGQNLAGYTELRLTAHAGQRVTLWHGETLDAEGNFTQANYEPGARNKEGGIPQKTELICREGLNVYKPSFSSFGFRYVKVETDAELADAEFTAITVYSRMEQTASFECGNADVNRLFLNSLWSMRSNFCDIPTDCPTRERAGWTGDAGAFAPTGVYLADCLPVFRKWLADCRISQRSNGCVANISPRNNVGGIITRIIRGSAGWGDAAVIVPYTLYECYGDAAILEENYGMMRAWVDFSAKRAAKCKLKHIFKKMPYKKYLVDTGFHFGEWLEPDVDQMESMRANMSNGCPEVATAYLYYSASLLSKSAAVLGKTADAEKYAALAENARSAYRLNLTDGGRIRSKRQAEYVRPMALGLLDEEEMPAAAADLAALVAENGYHLNTGFLATPFLCRMLAENGQTETAYKLLLQDSCPGWLYAVKKGATTIWETWDGIREDGSVHDSFNHYSYGAVSGWLLGGVCGIRLKNGELRIEPYPSEQLGYAAASWQSPCGLIESKWRYEGDTVRYEVTVPANITAVLKLPDGSEHSLNAGTYEF